MRVLQPGPEHPGSTYIPAVPENLSWGWVVASGTPPAAKVVPGEVVTVDTISHEGLLEDQGRDPRRYFGAHGVSPDDVLADAVALAASSVRHDPAVDGPHVVTGPVWVEGAEPGDVVTIEFLQLQARAPYGVVSNRHQRGALPGELPVAREGEVVPRVVSRFASLDGNGTTATVWAPDGRGLSVPLRPFLGLVAVGPPDGPAHSVPPGAHGGNHDVRLFGEGTRMHLPVRAEGALVQLGDPHFAQGDGEVALTALEGSLRAVVRLGLTKRACPAWDLPYGETEDAWVVLGFHEDLDEAVKIATRAALSLVTEQTGLDQATAYAWLSAAADLSVSQVVDGVKGVHFSLPKAGLVPRVAPPRP